MSRSPRLTDCECRRWRLEYQSNRQLTTLTTPADRDWAWTTALAWANRELLVIRGPRRRDEIVTRITITRLTRPRVS
jgi:hypothetical protein